MKIQRNKLLQALETVKPGLASKEMIEQSTSFCFMNGNVVTFNDEISVSAPVEGIDFEGAIGANELFAFLQKLKTDEIDVELKGNELIVQSGRSKATITIQQELTLPIDEIGTINKWKKLPDDFAAGLNFAMGSCSRDMSRPVLTCVHINGSILESSDSYRIANYTLLSEMPIKPFLLPANSCVKVIKMLPDEISTGEGWIHFKKDKVVMSCRIFDEEYPDTSKHLTSKGEKLQFPHNLLESLELANIFAKRDHILDERVTIQIENNKFLIKSQSDSGKFEQKSRIEFKGEITFEITPYLLKDILKQTTTAKLKDNKLIFSGDNWKYLTLLQ